MLPKPTAPPAAANIAPILEVNPRVLLISAIVRFLIRKSTKKKQQAATSELFHSYFLVDFNVVDIQGSGKDSVGIGGVCASDTSALLRES